MKKKIRKPFNIKEWQKGSTKVETKGGHPVRILCIDSQGREPIIGLIDWEDGSDSVGRWRPDGNYYNAGYSDYDLVIVEEIEEPERWADDKDAIGNGWFIDMNSDISQGTFYLNDDTARNVFATRKQAKAALAAARISQLMAHDERYGGVITDEEWKDPSTYKFAFMRSCGNIHVNYYNTNYCFPAFHTEEQRTLFLKENERLVKDYLMID